MATYAADQAAALDYTPTYASNPNTGYVEGGSQPLTQASAPTSGLQYVGSQLQYVSPSGQILPPSAAPSNAAPATTTPTPSTTPPVTTPVTPPPPAGGGTTVSLAKGTIVGQPQTIKNADGTVTTVVTMADGNGGFTSSQTTSGTPTTTPSSADESALGAITDVLDQAGLSSVATTAWDQLNKGIPGSQIISDIRSGNPLYGNAYAQRFPGMAALAAKGQAITEADYISKEAADTQLLNQYLGPQAATAFANTAYLGTLIGNNVNSADLQSRLVAAQNSVASLDSNITQYAKDTYGLDSGHLAAWALDPNQSLQVIQQQSQAMQIGGAALQQGFKGGLGVNGELSQTQAQNLANANVTQAQAQAGFNNIGQEGQFSTQLPGDIANALTNQQLINAQFKTNASDVIAFNRLQQQKVNEFNEGGAIASSATGVTGIGASNLTA